MGCIMSGLVKLKHCDAQLSQCVLTSLEFLQPNLSPWLSGLDVSGMKLIKLVRLLISVIGHKEYTRFVSGASQCSLICETNPSCYHDVRVSAWWMYAYLWKSHSFSSILEAFLDWLQITSWTSLNVFNYQARLAHCLASLLGASTNAQKNKNSIMNLKPYFSLQRPH